MMTPKKPTLSNLRGSTQISSELRELLGIDNGVLMGEVRTWADFNTLIKDYLVQNDNCSINGKTLLSIILNALGKISDLKLKEENQKKGNKIDRLVLVNDKAILVPQANIFKNYCGRMKSYLSNPVIGSQFIYQFAKTQEHIKKEKIKLRRQEEEKEANDKLIHEGKMNAYLAAENGSSEIRYDLRKRKREKGKGKGKEEEEQEEQEEKEEQKEQEEQEQEEQEQEEQEEQEERRSRCRTASSDAVEDFNEISFITTTSGGSYNSRENSFDSDASITLGYITSFDELAPITKEDLYDLQYMSNDLPMAERLNISGISFVDSIEDKSFLPEALDNDVQNMVNKFTRAIEYNTNDMLLSPLTIEHLNVITLLNTTFFNKNKENGIYKFNYQYYNSPQKLKNMENDFKIKFVVPFVNAVFHINDKLVVYWDAPLDIYLDSDMAIQRRQTTDAKIKSVDGMEIGLIEVKPFNTPLKQIEEDVVRLAEISKKILHKRILNAKGDKELVTFAVMISGEDIEYYEHRYQNQRTEEKYVFKLLKKSTLPTFPHTFNNMSLALESWMHVKKMMMDSIASESDICKPYLYSESYKTFEPTVTLLKLR